MTSLSVHERMLLAQEKLEHRQILARVPSSTLPSTTATTIAGRPAGRPAPLTAGDAKTDYPNSDGIGKDLVQVEVGEEKEGFTVHKDLLTAVSPYFKAAFEGGFKEAKNKSVPISDATPLQFRLFLNWIYFRRLPKHSNSNLGGPDCTTCKGACKPSNIQVTDLDPIADIHKNYPEFPELSEGKDEELEDMITEGPWDMGNLYVLADRCEVPTLRRAIIDRLFYLAKAEREVGMYHHRISSPTTTLASYAGVIHAMRNLPITSPLCRLLVDTYVNFYHEFDDEKCETEKLFRQKLPLEFVFAVMRSLSKNNVSGEEARLRDKCVYHEHDQDHASKQVCKKAEAERNLKRKRDFDDEDDS
ncbi:hypothetical protein E6O75_ATG01082 [Venturia nashicola]|uniref:BTB domain-containing protein n=1 Tax=Venturia nashicola TaxID=86259 RepID=A0A4Z1PUC9_9PEZI|nr:hypothetical protein E6O75_ATG01082 [Venturia nashicola]